MCSTENAGGFTSTIKYTLVLLEFGEAVMAERENKECWKMGRMRGRNPIKLKHDYLSSVRQLLFVVMRGTRMLILAHRTQKANDRRRLKWNFLGLQAKIPNSLCFLFFFIIVEDWFCLQFAHREENFRPDEFNKPKKPFFFFPFDSRWKSFQSFQHWIELSRRRKKDALW